MPHRDSSISKALDGIHKAFSISGRRSSSSSSGSTSSRASNGSRSPTTSKLDRTNSFMSSYSSNSSAVSTDTRAVLAEQGYPHLHIKEKIYESCPRFPKHSTTERIRDCTCGKVTLEKHREWCYIEADIPCSMCERAKVNTFQGTNINLNMFNVR